MRQMVMFGVFVGMLASTAVAIQPIGADQFSVQRNAKVTLVDSQEYLLRARNTLRLAQEGGYGHIKKRDLELMVKAMADLEAVLGNHDDSKELTTDEKLSVTNAQEVLRAIAQSDDKSRMVCERVQEIGSRVSSRLCLTVGERERRAKEAAATTDTIMRTVCIANENHPCHEK